MSRSRQVFVVGVAVRGGKGGESIRQIGDFVTAKSLAYVELGVSRHGLSHES